MYIGMEFMKQAHFKNALTQFEKAESICDTDPRIYNEIATAHYKEKNYQEAKLFFEKALQLCKESQSSTYESILVNLGHCMRKLK